MEDIAELQKQLKQLTEQLDKTSNSKVRKDMRSVLFLSRLTMLAPAYS
jgi:hypothetical protein